MAKNSLMTFIVDKTLSEVANYHLVSFTSGYYDLEVHKEYLHAVILLNAYN